MAIRIRVKYPNELSGLECWYDGAQFNAVADSTAVATWTDKSGNGRDLTQATTANRPLVASSLNGNKYLAGDGTARTIGITYVRNQPLTILWVGKFITNAGSSSVAFTTPNSRASLLTTGAGSWFEAKANATNQQLANSNPYVFSQLTFQINAATPYSTARVNGKTFFTGYVPSGGDVQGLSMTFSNAAHCEYISYNRILTSDEIAMVERYLKFKWGL